MSNSPGVDSLEYPSPLALTIFPYLFWEGRLNKELSRLGWPLVMSVKTVLGLISELCNRGKREQRLSMCLC